METDDLKNIIENHENRIKKLEEEVFSRKETRQLSKKDYKGLAGGIRLLIDNGFLNEPKSANEIQTELKREGYHHPIASLSKILSVNFTKNHKLLSRIKEDKCWKYVLRK